MGRVRDRGFTLPEILVVSALVVTAAAVALPSGLAALDDYRTAAAAQYLAGRCRLARMQAVRRSAAVALRFETVGPDVGFASFVDGNRNGVRTADIVRGIDLPLTTSERIGDQFPGVRFGLHEAVPAIGTSGLREARNPVQVGRSGIVTFTPNGTATSGTMYLRGRGSAQFAVRVLGATGRTRVLAFDWGAKQWIDR